MVTTFIFLDSDLALWTSLDLFVTRPLFVQAFEVLSAAGAFVPLLAAFEAHVKSAFAHNMSFAFAFYVSSAVWSRTPSKFLVKTYFNIFSEFKIFL